MPKHKSENMVLLSAKVMSVLSGLLILFAGVSLLMDRLRIAQNSTEEPSWFFVIAVFLLLMVLPPTLLLWAVGLYIERHGKQSNTSMMAITALCTVGLLSFVATVFVPDYLRSTTALASQIFTSLGLFLLGSKIVKRYKLNQHSSDRIIRAGLIVFALGFSWLLLSFAYGLRSVVSASI